MILQHATVQLRGDDQYQEFSDIIEEFRALVEKRGWKLIASWMTVIGHLGEVHNLWTIESLAHYESFKQEWADPHSEFGIFRKKLAAVITDEISRVAIPLPCSPLK